MSRLVELQKMKKEEEEEKQKFSLVGYIEFGAIEFMPSLSSNLAFNLTDKICNSFAARDETSSRAYRLTRWQAGKSACLVTCKLQTRPKLPAGCRSTWPLFSIVPIQFACLMSSCIYVFGTSCEAQSRIPFPLGLNSRTHLNEA